MTLRYTAILLYLLDNIQLLTARASSGEYFVVHYLYKSSYGTVEYPRFRTRVANNPFSINFDSVLALEMGSEHYVRTVKLEVEKGRPSLASILEIYFRNLTGK